MRNGETPWIRGAQPLRNRPGVYQRYFPYPIGGDSGALFCYWSGATWFVSAHTPEQARTSRHPSPFQDLPWRGLRADPYARRST